MTSIDQRIEAFSSLGKYLKNFTENPEEAPFEDLNEAITLAFHKNGWFTRTQVLFALNYWADQLNETTLEQWVSTYPSANHQGKRVILVLAGNIPLVGFHDVVSTMLAGQVALIKCSSSDDVLIPFLLSKLISMAPELKEHYELQTGIVKDIDAAIATGSNNSSRHFHEYFGHLPHVIRKNRTGVAVLDGTETELELEDLMDDAFRYFGLGCRNITKLFLPAEYDLNKIFKASLTVPELMENKKYENNYTYHKALMMLERQDFLENDLIIMRESSSLYSPVSVLQYEYYDTPTELTKRMEAELDDIQCVVGHSNLPFGSAQKPALTDYADGIDTMEFLVTL